MIKEIGYCHGIENYARHLTGPRAGRAAADAARLPAARRADDRRREPPDGAADPRDVSRRPLAQGSAGRLRLPPAVGARQPAAELRGVGAAGRPACCSSRRRRGPTSCAGRAASSSSRSSGRPGCVDPPIDVRPVQGQVDDLLAEIRDRAGAQRARARDDADQADGRGPDAVLSGARRARSATCTPTSTRSSASRSCATCGAGSSTCWSASTCCAKGSTCRKCRWWRSSTPTRKASCGRAGR